MIGLAKLKTRKTASILQSGKNTYLRRNALFYYIFFSCRRSIEPDLTHFTFRARQGDSYLDTGRAFIIAVSIRIRSHVREALHFLPTSSSLPYPLLLLLFLSLNISSSFPILFLPYSPCSFAHISIVAYVIRLFLCALHRGT